MSFQSDKAGLRHLSSDVAYARAPPVLCHLSSASSYIPPPLFIIYTPPNAIIIVKINNPAMTIIKNAMNHLFTLSAPLRTHNLSIHVKKSLHLKNEVIS